MRIADIKIGERLRKDMGDIDALAKSIRKNGLLHPVVVTPEGLLIAGQRRLEAAKLLGWEEIRVTEISPANLLEAERDENEVRKSLTRTEAVALGRMVEEEARKRNRERQREAAEYGQKGAEYGKKGGRGNVKPPCLNVQQGGLPDPRAARERKSVVIAARAVGMSEPTYVRAKAVTKAAEEDPARFGDLPAKMDETGNVGGMYKEMLHRTANPTEPVAEIAFPEKRRGFRKYKDAPFSVVTKRHQAVADGQKKRMYKMLSTMEAHSQGLLELDIPMICAVISESEKRQWVKAARDVAAKASAFARRLSEQGGLVREVDMATEV